MRKKIIIMAACLLMSVLASACSPTLQTVEVTRVVPQTVAVTQLVTQIVRVNITTTPIPADTPVPGITPSSVPLGIFSLLFYRPLVMVYDVTQWEDITPYNQPNAIAKNYLQSKKKSSCKIGVQGPINFNDPSQYKSEEAHLGNINYEVKIFSNNPDRSITTFYIDDKSLKGFNYENAFPVLSVQSDENEW